MRPHFDFGAAAPSKTPDGPTLRVTFSQVGRRAASSELCAELERDFPGVSTRGWRESGLGYFDSRTTLTLDVPTILLPMRLFRLAQKHGHASTSVGPWLLDTHPPGIKVSPQGEPPINRKKGGTPMRRPAF